MFLVSNQQNYKHDHNCFVHCHLFQNINLSQNSTKAFIFTLLSHNYVIRLSSTTLAEAVVSREGEDEKEEFCKDRLLASNVPWTCTPEDIRALFEKHGKVIDVELSMHNKTRNRGLAFVTMGSPEEASNALKNLKSYAIDRGENLTTLADKTENLRSQAQEFWKQGAKIRRKMWYQNMKIKFVVLGILLLLVLIIWVSVCHGFDCTN